MQISAASRGPLILLTVVGFGATLVSSMTRRHQTFLALLACVSSAGCASFPEETLPAPIVAEWHEWDNVGGTGDLRRDVRLDSEGRAEISLENRRPVGKDAAQGPVRWSAQVAQDQMDRLRELFAQADFLDLEIGDLPYRFGDCAMVPMRSVTLRFIFDASKDRSLRLFPNWSYARTLDVGKKEALARIDLFFRDLATGP